MGRDGLQVGAERGVDDALPLREVDAVLASSLRRDLRLGPDLVALRRDLRREPRHVAPAIDPEDVLIREVQGRAHNLLRNIDHGLPPATHEATSAPPRREWVPMAPAATKALCVVARRVRSFSNSHIGLKPLCAAVPSERFVRVAVVGLGYVGLPLAAAVAATGANVVGIDIDPEKVESVNKGRSPLRGHEPGLDDLVREQVATGRLRARLHPPPASSANVVAVCVETPIDPATHDPSYKALKVAIAEVGPHLKPGALVSIESTLAPGTMEGFVRPALERASRRTVGRDLHLVHCPERLTAG